jgi:hypothetical protein
MNTDVNERILSLSLEVTALHDMHKQAGLPASRLK